MGRLEPGHTESFLLDEVVHSRDLRQRIGRTAGGDAQLNLEYEETHHRINHLLDMYLKATFLSSSPNDRPKIPAQGYQVESD